MSHKKSSPSNYQQRQLLTESLDYYFAWPFDPIPPERYIDTTAYNDDWRCEFVHRCKLPKNTHYCLVDVTVENTVVGTDDHGKVKMLVPGTKLAVVAMSSDDAEPPRTYEKFVPCVLTYYDTNCKPLFSSVMQRETLK